VVAEGVETEAQAETLRRLGCDEMQGYLFSKPLAFDALLDLMQRQPR
jgi:EAL domain-containing protein (putative c-di-GMP-specific phosphodiesterase class I)